MRSEYDAEHERSQTDRLEEAHLAGLESAEEEFSVALEVAREAYVTYCMAFERVARCEGQSAEIESVITMLEELANE